MKWTTHLLLGLSILMYNLPLSGQQWEDQAIGLLPVDYGITSLSVVDENTVWAVAWDRNYVGSPLPSTHMSKVLRTTDGGSTWKIYDVEEAIGRKILDVVAFDSVTAFVTTQDHNNGQGRSVFKTTDGGINWVNKFTHHACGIWIRFFNQNDGVIINRPHIFTTNDGGDSWNPVDSVYMALFQSNEYTLIYTGTNSLEQKGNHLWFGTNQGRVFRSKDRGVTWEAFSTPLSLVVSVAFRDTLVGIALQPFSTGGFAISADGGETWSNLSSNTLSLSSIAFVPGTDSVLIGTSYNDDVVAYSTDLGSTWTSINIGYPYNATQFIDPETGWTSNGRVNAASDPAMFKWDSNIFTGIEDQETPSQHQIYPNPTSGSITVYFHKKHYIVKVVVRNLLGQALQVESYNGVDKITTNIIASPGIYLFEITDSDGNTSTMKILKE